MASNSLQSSCMLRIISLSPPPQPLRRRRFHVSHRCDGGAEQVDPSAAGEVDRRSMLLGLGGLYGLGATNLFSEPKPAEADPIKPPNLLLCGQAYDFSTGDPLEEKGKFCPPPYSRKILDYKLPEVTKMRVRKPAHLLTKREIRKFEKAITLMKKLDSYPSNPLGFLQQANIHAAYCNSAYPQVGNMGTPISVHNSWIFYPFHRWYLYFFERILAKLLRDNGEDDSDFALPFWNYDNDQGGMEFPKLYEMKDLFPDLHDQNRNQRNVSGGSIVDLSFNSGIKEKEKLKKHNVSVMYSEMIGRVDTTEAFMGQPYRAGDRAPDPTRGGTGEAGSHTSIHKWVGNPESKYNEDMGNFYSAGRDPAFYGLHANVDRLWTLWQGFGNNIPKSFDDPDYLNASFLFYDEEKNLVKVRIRDCLDNTKMGYEYEYVRMPWKYNRPAATDLNIDQLPAKYENVFPDLILRYITRVFVPKPTPGNGDEVLVLENISSDRSKFVKFDVYISVDDEEKNDRVEYVGTFAHLPHIHKHIDPSESMIEETNKLNISLKRLYDNINIDSAKDQVVVTLVPRSDELATIGKMNIVIKQHPKARQPGGTGSPNVGKEPDAIDTKAGQPGGTGSPNKGKELDEIDTGDGMGGATL